MAKKKKKTKKVPAPAHSPEEPAEELTAIEAIFPETEAHEDRHGFNLRVLPHYDDAEINHVSLTLRFRSEDVPMSTSDTSGLSMTSITEMCPSKPLHLRRLLLSHDPSCHIHYVHAVKCTRRHSWLTGQVSPWLPCTAFGSQAAGCFRLINEPDPAAVKTAAPGG